MIWQCRANCIKRQFSEGLLGSYTVDKTTKRCMRLLSKAGANEQINNDSSGRGCQSNGTIRPFGWNHSDCFSVEVSGWVLYRENGAIPIEPHDGRLHSASRQICEWHEPIHSNKSANKLSTLSLQFKQSIIQFVTNHLEIHRKNGDLFIHSWSKPEEWHEMFTVKYNSTATEPAIDNGLESGRR